MQRHLLVVCLVALLCGSGNAQQSSPASATQVVVPRLIRFSGTVKDTAGAKTVGITFTLHATPDDHSALWIETQSVPVDSTGKYTVLLGATKAEGIPIELFTSGDAHWLGVEVAGQAEQPRVLLVSVPYALKAAEAETLAGHAATEFVTSDKLNTAVEQQVQSRFNTTNSKEKSVNGVLSSTATNFTDSTTNQVVGVTQNGTGKALVATAVKNTAIYGNSTATTGSAVGVYGQSSSSGGVGLYGLASATGGSPVALFGSTPSTGGIAIAANETATSGNTIGLQSAVYSPSGTVAVLKSKGSGKLLSGQVGSANTEVISVDASGNLATQGTVQAYQYTGAGWAANLGYGYNGSIGIYGSSDSGYGVQGTSSGGDAVYGRSDSGTGVSGDGGTGTGVYGTSNGGYGVYGNSNTNYGVIGVSSSGNGVYGQISTAPQAGVVGRQTDASGNWGLYAFGNIGATGTKSSVVSVENGSRQVALYAVESPGVWFEDYGSGRLAAGVTSITIDPTYAQTVNTSVEYHVFLTPDGDCQGLYVSARTPTSFEVRELHQGKSSVAFSYRIVALRRGYEKQRLADVTNATPKLPAVKTMQAHKAVPVRASAAK